MAFRRAQTAPAGLPEAKAPAVDRGHDRRSDWCRRRSRPPPLHPDRSAANCAPLAALAPGGGQQVRADDASGNGGQGRQRLHAEQGSKRVRPPKRGTRHFLDRPPVLREAEGDAVRARTVLERPELLDQGAGFGPDRTRNGAHALPGTRFDTVVLILRL